VSEWGNRLLKVADMKPLVYKMIAVRILKSVITVGSTPGGRMGVEAVFVDAWNRNTKARGGNSSSGILIPSSQPRALQNFFHSLSSNAVAAYSLSHLLWPLTGSRHESCNCKYDSLKIGDLKSGQGGVGSERSMGVDRPVSSKGDVVALLARKAA